MSIAAPSAIRRTFVLQHLQVVAVGGADEELGGGVVRHDIRRVATVRDDAVDARVLLDVLAHRVDAGEEFDDAIEGIRAVVGVARRVRGLAVELEVDVRDGEAGAARDTASRSR